MPKLKYVEVKILPHHLPYLKETKDKGNVNMKNSLWLAAFAIYNMESAVKLSVEYHDNYLKVYQFIHNKLK